MRIARRIPTGKNTHSEYVIIISCQMQQRSYKCPSLLRYTYVTRLVIFKMKADICYEKLLPRISTHQSVRYHTIENSDPNKNHTECPKLYNLKLDRRNILVKITAPSTYLIFSNLIRNFLKFQRAKKSDAD